VDDALKEKLVAEYPAILRWAINGCLDWQANGLLRPDIVVAATKSYLEEQDLFAQWVDAECTTGLNDTDTHKRLFKSWCRFSLAAGVPAGSAVGFNERMQTVGFKPLKHTPGTAQARGWQGVALRSATDDDEQENRPYWNRD
jgi:putative DNA primase/helicase